MGYQIHEMPLRHKAPGVSTRLPDLRLRGGTGAHGEQEMWRSDYLSM